MPSNAPPKMHPNTMKLIIGTFMAIVALVEVLKAI